MSQHADILDTQESMRGAFVGALTLHIGILGAMLLSGWLAGRTESFGSKEAGGSAVGIEAVSSIPIPHQGPENPLANDTKSEVPQTPTKALDRTKAEKPERDAIALKSRKAKKKPAETASTRQRFRPYEQLDPNQLTSKQAPQVSSPLFSAMPGAGRIGANTTLGTRFAGYAAQIQQLVAQKWRTGDVEARTGPVVIATFDLMRDGSTRNLQLLQSSGIPSLDFSVRRAILDASPFPPIPPGFDRDSAKVEFTFELKR